MEVLFGQAMLINSSKKGGIQLNYAGYIILLYMSLLYALLVLYFDRYRPSEWSPVRHSCVSLSVTACILFSKLHLRYEIDRKQKS